MSVCLTCGKSISRRNSKFCSNRCQVTYQRNQYINKWLNGEVDGTKCHNIVSNYVRHYLLEINNGKCCRCGWGEINSFTGTSPLEIHHKDNDPTNNTFDNLEVLCPNCHSLTSTWKGANKGKGSKRVYRRKSNSSSQDNPEQE